MCPYLDISEIQILLPDAPNNMKLEMGIGLI